ncbi:hypothetical protein H8N03_12630 [Ramlibacter sp. USB13]|uniref:Uncharacterized protein n=1 Tax=Ramlibacter cellulosilyticus TaxID=2764187 RepID=A0A923MSH8_9BURK|nr:hypothetical protein [Ramlibacter cellulosilyticus]MBC5783794.1 hypothetical protein [Ramlibacter cellulosilyticus]
MPDPQQYEDQDSGSYEAYFRDPSLATEAPLAWALQQRLEVVDAVRGLLSGAQAAARLRLWCFMELASQPQGRLLREDVNQLFHVLRPEALEMVLKRLRELGVLVWDPTAQDYHLSPLAQQVHALLAPLTKESAGDDDEMASLLAQVAGAQALGLADASQVRHLHAQLARLHDDFANAIASGSEALLRAAQPRFDRALALVERAGEALTALIRSDFEDPRLEKEARALGQGQARLLSMASQFTRALQQADRQRVTLGSTGVTSSDVRRWLQQHPAPHELLGEALAAGVRPVFVSQHDLVDVAEGEFERDRPDPLRSTGLPPPAAAAAGTMETLRMPQELEDLITKLAAWSTEPRQPDAQQRPVRDAVVGGRFAQAAYRLQLLPLLGDAQARTLQGQTGDLARAPWRAVLTPQVETVADAHVAAVSTGHLHPERDSPP